MLNRSALFILMAAAIFLFQCESGNFSVETQPLERLHSTGPKQQRRLSNLSTFPAPATRSIPNQPQSRSFHSIHVETLDIDDPLLFMEHMAGSGTVGFSGDNGVATLGELRAAIPFVDTIGDIYLPDTTSYGIRRVHKDVLSTWAGSGAQSSSGTSASLSAVSLYYPISIVGLSGGDRYFCDRRYVWFYSISTGIVSRFAGSSSLGTGFSGDTGAAGAAQLNNPHGLWLTTANVLYIADSANHRIRRVASNIITTVAGQSGPPGYTGDSVSPLSSSLNGPVGCYMNTAGHLFIADTSNHRIRKVFSNIITTFAGTGTDGYNGDDISAVSAQLNYPYDVKGDSLGNIYIADNLNFRIRVVLVSTGYIATLFGSGTDIGSGLVSSGISPRSAPFHAPQGLWVVTDGTVYFTDYYTVHRGIRMPMLNFETFEYTGSPQSFTVPNYVSSIAVDVRGATVAYRSNDPDSPGRGARVQATLSVTPGSTLHIYVGGRGQTGPSCLNPRTGGWNGGGDGNGCAVSGGGASDMRRGGTALSNRIVVAGGGGGYYWNSLCNTLEVPGGDGGQVGQDGGNWACGGAGGGIGGEGGTASSGGTAGSDGATAGTLGVGGNAANWCPSPGGGGGYYGGEKDCSYFHYH
jgi:hypothetical protein